jgi:hypothetical protein
VNSSSYADWCKANGCDHAHCPAGHDKPQPVMGDDGELYCMGCWFEFGELTRCEPCVPGVCA